MIEVKGFRKTFRKGFRRKSFVAADGIDFSVDAGEIFGFLGPNGAGKTTTIKAILDLIRPDAGTLRIMGHSPGDRAWRRDVGYMPEHPTFYDYLTGLEMVTWFAQLSGMGRHEAETEAKRQLQRVGLERSIRRRLREYSKGMLQRAGLAQAMVGRPKLLILDEPMTGLDPIGRRDVRELLRALRHEGCTVFYSTHILPDVEMTCDRVSILEQGQTRRTGRLEDILRETTRGVSVTVSGLAPEVSAKVRENHPVAHTGDEQLRVDFSELSEARCFVGDILASGGALERFEPHRDDLEAIFLRSLKSTERGASAEAEGRRA